MPTRPQKADTIASPETLDARLQWLWSWTIHHANQIRESRDGLKVGGHQASCASITMIMAALYFHALRPQDKVAVKPHAGPVLHAIKYLLGNQSLDQHQRFRGLGVRKAISRGPRTRFRSTSRPDRSAWAWQSPRLQALCRII